MATHPPTLAPAAREQEEALVAALQKLAAGDASFRAILFGSRAAGEPLRDSDFDLVVVSDRFRDVPYPRRGERLAAALWAVAPVDLICLTPEEHAAKEAGLGVVGVAARTGRVLV